MTRFSAFLFALLLGATLSTTGCGTKESGKQPVSPRPAAGQAANPKVLIETSKGNITIELLTDKAPVTVKNFLGYVNSGFYNGTVFHRVIPDFMIQGGGMLPDMSEKPNGAPIMNEANNGLHNLRGTLAMARTNDPHSATSQFFINVADNEFLNHRGQSFEGWGYAVFGRVVSGMEVADAIAAEPRGNQGMHEDVPLQPVIMKQLALVR
jgi:cyclophilin family peptidyl-prolyl cis-trans isomerase